jgi:lipopolysaccharide/colanic/teichoic acid biosynthesis glycosyltransferase
LVHRPGIGTQSQLHVPIAPRPLTVRALKRALDVVGASVGLVVLSPILAVAAAAILLDDGRPVLFRQPRAGLGGKSFVIAKFRTMGVDADHERAALRAHNEVAGGASFKLTNDPRVTRLGRFLRRTSIDELPQLWNVLRGDMAIVGPRPIRPSFYAELCRDIPQYWQRLVVRPGVTGFAQTRITREESWANKLAHDMEYIADRSVGLYFSVLLATVAKVLGRGPAAPQR